MKKIILISILVLFVFSGSAQNDADIDATFNTAGWFGTAGIVKKIAKRPDGKIIICGFINFYKGTAVKNIFRLNADGTLDASFNLGNNFSE